MFRPIRSSVAAWLFSRTVFRFLCSLSFLNDHNNNDNRSGDAGAAGKAQIATLEKDVLTLSAEADELKRFTQEYMVKASSDKQNVMLNSCDFLCDT